MDSIWQNASSAAKRKGITFTRRHDLTSEIRLHIAYHAWMGSWGIVSRIAQRYMISRTFVYTLMKDLQQGAADIFGQTCHAFLRATKRTAIMLILSLRLEGRCSIPAISMICKRLGTQRYTSVGAASQVLHYFGSHLPNTLSVTDTPPRLVVMASDELFSHMRPILISVDPISSAILRIEVVAARSVEAWKHHWQCIYEHGHLATYLVNDEGIAMAGAQKELLPEITRQADSFHGIAHRLGLWVDRLEKKAYAAIEYEQNRLERRSSAKSQEVFRKKDSEYQRAKRAAKETIELYEGFTYLYGCLIQSLQVFDPEGNLNTKQSAQMQVRAALQLICELQNKAINKEVHTIEKLLADLFSYLDEAKHILEYLHSCDIAEDVLKSFCIAWQYHKVVIKTKDSERRNQYKQKEHQMLELLEAELDTEFELTKETLYGKLDEIIQSSSLVETINSILRMYLNTSKNQVNQSMLNLIMYYHNHRRYTDAKRKGKTPIEILTGRVQQTDWLELLLQEVDPQDFRLSNKD